MSLREDKVLARVFCDSDCKGHYSPLPLVPQHVQELCCSAFCRARKMFLFFIFMNDHIIYLEYAKHQQVLMRAASKSSQQTV